MQNDVPEPISESLFPMYGATFWWNVAALEILGLVGASPFVLTITEFSPFPTILGFFVAALILIPVFFFCVFFTARNRHCKGGSVIFNDGLLSVHHHFGGNHCFCSEKLSECRWFRGSRSWATVPWSENFFGPWLAGRSLLIEFPARWQTEVRYRTDKKGVKRVQYPPGPVIVAVGHTPETERQWENLLFRLGIRHDEQRESQPAPVTDGCVLASMISLFGTLFSIVSLLASRLKTLLIQQSVSEDIAQGIWFCCVTLATALPLFVLLAFFYFHRRNQDVKMTGNFLVSPREVIAWLFIPIAFVLLTYWANPVISHQGKFFVTMVIITVMFLSAEIFRQIAKPVGSREQPADESLHVPTEDTTVDDFSRYSGHFDGGAYGP